MCEVVKTCHEQGIVLRDLKLRKFVFADSERWVLLCDADTFYLWRNRNAEPYLAVYNRPKALEMLSIKRRLSFLSKNVHKPTFFWFPNLLFHKAFEYDTKSLLPMKKLLSTLKTNSKQTCWNLFTETNTTSGASERENREIQLSSWVLRLCVEKNVSASSDSNGFH